jgi:hypothetical protein
MQAFYLRLSRKSELFFHDSIFKEEDKEAARTLDSIFKR